MRSRSLWQRPATPARERSFAEQAKRHPKKQDVPAKAQRGHLFGSAVGHSSQRTTDFLTAGPEVTGSFDEGRTAYPLEVVK